MANVAKYGTYIHIDWDQHSRNTAADIRHSPANHYSQGSEPDSLSRKRNMSGGWLTITKT